jgi:hypothetical protein
MSDLTSVPWRAHGTQVSAETRGPDGMGEPIGSFDSAELATEAAAAHNEALARRAAYRRAASRRGVNAAGPLAGVQIGDGNFQNNVF